MEIARAYTANYCKLGPNWQTARFSVLQVAANVTIQFPLNGVNVSCLRVSSRPNIRTYPSRPHSMISSLRKKDYRRTNKMSPRGQLPPLIITFLVVNIIAVGLRVWIRVHIRRSFGVDDSALCLSLVRVEIPPHNTSCETSFVDMPDHSLHSFSLPY